MARIRSTGENRSLWLSVGTEGHDCDVFTRNPLRGAQRSPFLPFFFFSLHFVGVSTANLRLLAGGPGGCVGCVRTQVGQKVLLEVKQNKEDPASRPFFAAEIAKRQNSFLRIEKSFIVLSKSELGRCIGRDVRAKDPRTHTMRLQTSDGEETVYVFRDPANPHRRLVSGHWMAEEKCEVIMGADSHYHTEQAAETMKASYHARCKESGEADLDGKVLNSLPEFLAKVQGKQSENAHSKHAPVSHGPECENVQQVSDSDDDDGDDDDDAGAPLEVPRLSAFAVASARGGSLGSSVKPSSKADGDVGKAATPKMQRMSSNRSMGGGASSIGEDGTSVAAEDQPGHPHFDRLPEAVQLSTLTAKLNVSKILEGKKLGRQIRYAGIQAAKMEAHHAAVLETHIQSCNWAQVLSPANIGSAKDAAIREAHEGLKDVVQAWPEKLIQTCWSKAKRHLVSQVASSPDLRSIHELLTACRPWLEEGEAARKVDLLKPCVRYMPGSATDKVVHLHDAVMDATCQLVKQGEPSRQKLALLMSTMLTWLSGALQLDNLDDCYVRSCVELKKCYKAV